MKNKKTRSVAQVTQGFLLLALVTSCSPHSKQPVEDIAEFRKHAITQDKIKEQTITEEQSSPVEPHVIRETVIVKEPQILIQEQAKIDDSLLIIDTQDILSFVEGIPETYQIKVRHLAPKLTSTLTAENLPEGMKIQKKSSDSVQDIYELSWTPSLYFVNSQRFHEEQDIHIEAKSTSSEPLLKSLIKRDTLKILVTRQNVAPSDLEVVGLPAEIKNQTQTKFSIKVKVPGIDDRSLSKPILVKSVDPSTLTQGSQKQWDASRHVLFSNQPALKYLGNEIWQFDLVVDTKDISAQASQLPAKMQMLMRVFSPNGLVTPSQVIQFTLTSEAP